MNERTITFKGDITQIRRLRDSFWNMELNEAIPVNICEQLDELDEVLVTIIEADDNDTTKSSGEAI
jgi:hypothetical protein|tara:strand:- start:1193 stop:1390 length:198 start_codon:yes stop_codon:yes gene_type:complete